MLRAIDFHVRLPTMELMLVTFGPLGRGGLVFGGQKGVI